MISRKFLFVGAALASLTFATAPADAATFLFSGEQEHYVVPTTGVYLLTARGATGGASAAAGGFGALVTGRIGLTAGTTLDIFVGGMSEKAAEWTGNGGSGGGGGGGTFVLFSSGAALVVAGGGGGSGAWGPRESIGGNGLTLSAGSPGPGNGGSAGKASSGRYLEKVAAGGGGVNSDGGGSEEAEGGRSPGNGAAGGVNNSRGGDGGFGGGGGGGGYGKGGGGGGGFTGGDGGNDSGGGGGGTSYIRADATDVVSWNVSFVGNGRFDLYLIEESVSAVPEPATWAMMMLGFGAIGGVVRRRRTRVRFATA